MGLNAKSIEHLYILFCKTMHTHKSTYALIVEAMRIVSLVDFLYAV